MTTGYLASSFDLLNVAHLDVIAQARAQCDELVVAVFSDELAAAVTGRPPVVPLEERMVLVGHVRGVSEVVVHQSPVDPDLGAELAFTVADQVPPDLTDAVPLVPRRESASETLLAALRPVSQESVAS